MERMKAIVIGGSVGGLFAANMLLRQGWDVEVFERAASGMSSRGAGIAGHTELTALLRQAGVNEEPLGIDVDGRVAYGMSGQIIDRFEHPQYLTSWGFVYRQLHAAFPSERYHSGQELVDLQPGPGKPVALFADGRQVQADLVVGADGFRSRVRAVVAPQIEPRYGGYVAFRGVMAEAALSCAFRAEMVDLWSFVFPGDGQLIGYPLLGPDDSSERGQRRYSYLWYRNIGGADALNDLLTDASGTTHEYSIPPPLIRPEHIERLKAHAVATLPPQFSEIVLRAEQHMLQPIYDVESTRIAFGRIALIGDAAFVARPHVGIGVLKAAQDAQALAACVGNGDCQDKRAADGVVNALERFNALRVPPGRQAVRFAQHLGAFIEQGLQGPWTDPTLGVSPEYLIRVSARPMEQLTQHLASHASFQVPV